MNEMKRVNTKVLLVVIIIVAALMVASFAAFFITRGGSARPNDGKVAELLDLGQKYLDEGDYANALLAFEQVLELDDKVVEAYRGMSDAYIGLEDYDMAVIVLDEGIEKTRDNSLIRRRENIIEKYRDFLIDYELDDALEGEEEEPEGELFEELSDSEIGQSFRYHDLIIFNSLGGYNEFFGGGPTRVSAGDLRKFWNSILIYLGDSTIPGTYSKSFDNDGWVGYSKDEVMDIAWTMFDDFSDLPAIPSEFSETVRESGGTYYFRGGDRGDVRYEISGVNKNSDGTVEVAMESYDTIDGESYYLSNTRHLVLRKNEHTNHNSPTPFAYTIVSVWDVAGAGVPEIPEIEEEVPAASGIDMSNYDHLERLVADHMNRLYETDVFTIAEFDRRVSGNRLETVLRSTGFENMANRYVGDVIIDLSTGDVEIFDETGELWETMNVNN